MAKTEIINIRGNKERCVNISHTVGAGGKNHIDDVLLIQTLFSYLYRDQESAIVHILPKHYKDGMFAGMEYFPRTGILDVRTLQTILMFQAMHRPHLLSVDGAIHPASYQGRVIKSTTEPLMMITYLHILAKKTEMLFGGAYGVPGDYIQVLKNITPELHI